MSSNQIDQYIQENPSASGFDLYSKYPHVFPNVPAAQRALEEIRDKNTAISIAEASTTVAVAVAEEQPEIVIAATPEILDNSEAQGHIPESETDQQIR